MSPGTGVLDRFHQALVEEIGARRPEYLRRPFTVAEIYQELVPYGTHRDRIGVEMNGDYEDALLRLLAGEGGYLVLESEPARRRIRAELETPNPNTGLFREFAAVDVHLAQDRLDADGPAVPVQSLSPAGDGVDGVDGVDGAEGPVAGTGDYVLPIGVEPEDDDVEATPPDGGPPADADAEACRWCRETLPERPNLHYCPFCGSDLRVVPCPSCGEELEPGWRFCIACGTEVAEE